MVALCQKFGRLLIGAEARFFARTDITNFSTSLNQSPAPKRRILARLPSGYKGPNAFALFIKDQLRGKTGGVSEMVKIASTNWKSLDEDEKQNYSERAKKIGAELRDNFKKLTSEEKQDLWVEHIVKKAKRRRFRMKKKLRKFYAETNRPKHPSRSYILFVKERFEKQTEPFKTRDKVRKFVAEAAQQWRQMTDAEKQPYVDQGQCNIATYNAELAEWKQKYANEIRAWNEAMDKAARKGWRKKKVLRGGKSKSRRIWRLILSAAVSSRLKELKRRTRTYYI